MICCSSPLPLFSFVRRTHSATGEGKLTPRDDDLCCVLRGKADHGTDIDGERSRLTTAVAAALAKNRSRNVRVSSQM